ncbi:MAG TPA: TonB-dependent receptor [Blastocatellia bacterium]|nr:TonB-dependent receptor [Blastocatellia bacterium]
MKKRHLIQIAMLMFLALTLPLGADAQILYGSLTGNVTDPTGAVVAGAKVEALNIGTGASNVVATDERGAYLFNNLQAGVYKVIITAQTFKALAQDNIRIDANATRRLDAQLLVGDVTAVIQVTAGAEALQTDRADVNTQLQASQIANLPITSSAGRNFQALYRIIPGFNQVTEGFTSDGGNPQRSIGGNVNGTSRQNNLVRIDGASNAYLFLPENTAYVPPSESIQSVSVATSSYDAEQGNAVGAAVNVVTKSGTNQFHGSVFEYHTDNALKAKNRFNPVGFRQPKYILNQYGGAVGGPIKKNKLFFFTDYEATKRRQFVTRGTPGTVINPAGIFDSAGNANLSGAIAAGTDCNVNPTPGCVYDPNTGNADGSGRLAFLGNIIPANRIDPAARAILGRINKSGFLNNDGVTAISNYNNAGSAELNRDTNDIKINYVPTNRATVFGRYSISRAKLFDPPFLGDALGGATGGGQLGLAPSRIQSVGLGGTYTLSPSLILDINAGYTRQRLGAEHAPDLDLGNFGVETLKIPGTNGDNRLAAGTPAFQFTQGGWNGLGNVDTGNPFQFRDNQYVVNANLSWTSGPHDLRFGMEHGRAGINHFQPQGGAFQTPRGSFQFNGNVTALLGGPTANKANSLADFLLGLPFRAGKAVQNLNPNSLRFRTWSAYARDRWQFNPKLTINYGVRWEYYPFATADNGKGVKLFDPNTGNVLVGGFGNTPVDNGVDVGHGQFLPRLGLAYRLDSKMVVRIGYGMSADSNNFRFFRNNFPATTNSDSRGATDFQPASTLTGANKPGPYPNLFTGIPVVPLPDFSSGVIRLPDGVGPGLTVPFEFRRGYVHSYNLTLQREIAGFVAEAGYVGTRSIRTLTNENLNAAPLGGGNAGRMLNAQLGRNFVDIGCLCPDTNAYYDSLQTKVTRRMGGGSNIGLVYTLSKAINSEDNEELGSVLFAGGFLLWAHPLYRDRNKAIAGYDRTHNLTVYGTYELPFGRGKQFASEGLLSKFAGDWNFSWLMTRISGSPFTLATSAASLNAPGNAQTPDQVGTVRIVGGVANIAANGVVSCPPTDLSCHYFDPTSFRAVPGNEIRFGSVGRNTIRGPGFFNLDVGLFRDFPITEGIKFQFRMEMFGATNTPRFANPGTDVANPSTFGVITSTLNLSGRGFGTGGERQVWFAGKVMF